MDMEIHMLEEIFYRIYYKNITIATKNLFFYQPGHDNDKP